MLSVIGHSNLHRRRRNYSGFSSRKSATLSTMKQQQQLGQRLCMMLLTTTTILIVLISTAKTVIFVSSKTPSLIPFRKNHNVKRRIRNGSDNNNTNNNNTIRNDGRKTKHTDCSSSSLLLIRTKSKQPHHRHHRIDNDQKKEAPWISGFKNSLASGLAAGCSKLILAPLDTIKTLQQSSSMMATMPSSAGAGAGALSLRHAAQTIMKRPKGLLEFYSGIGVAVVGSMPSVGLYFGIYSFCKKTFQQWDPDHYEQRQTLYIALSAAVGNTIASASRVPYEVVKQKFQTNVYSTFNDALRDMSFKTLFPTGGIASQMLRDIPYAIVTLLTYEHLKSVWKVRAENRFPTVPTRSWDMLVGGLAGGIGSYVTNPMDVIKTRLQTDGTSSNLYGGSIRTCVELTLKEGGPAAFLRGSVPRLLHKVPANAFFFLFYEFFRSVLRVQDDASTAVNTATRNKRISR